jgi:hypothetical protein
MSIELPIGIQLMADSYIEKLAECDRVAAEIVKLQLHSTALLEQLDEFDARLSSSVSRLTSENITIVSGDRLLTFVKGKHYDLPSIVVSQQAQQ